MSLTNKVERIRDVVHDLIIFRLGNDIDALAWELINTKEFQRLRKIKQLGFSEFVYPGATHTRFSHCLGVFHTARNLLDIIKYKLGGDFNEDRADVTLIAALLHDIGHGPFSHAFENSEKEQGRLKDHETWSKEIISGNTNIKDIILKHKDVNFMNDVAGLLVATEPADIYSSIVSSQFDADRLDYIRRDRYMTGTGLGHIDFKWLLDCLEITEITVGDSVKGDYINVESLYLNHKGLHAAENYLLARYNLYSDVYFHKTTRAAEKMLSAYLKRISKLITDRLLDDSGLDPSNPLVIYLSSPPTLENYISLDDSVIWNAINQSCKAKDNKIKILSKSLFNRNLFKCFDPFSISRQGENSILKFLKAISDKEYDTSIINSELLLKDSFTLSLYGEHKSDEPGALYKVLIGQPNNRDPEDIFHKSKIISSITNEKIFRFYTPDDSGRDELRTLWEKVNP